MVRKTNLRVGLMAVALGLLALAGCRGSNGGGATRSSAIPDTVPGTAGVTTTTTVPDQEAAYKVYRAMLDESLKIGADINRRPTDGSLDGLMTPEARSRLVVNLEGLKANGLFQKGQLVTQLLSGEIVAGTANLRVCVRDDVDQFDRTGKQLTPVGPGTPQVQEIRLVRSGASWLVDATKETGLPCDV